MTLKEQPGKIKYLDVYLEVYSMETAFIFQFWGKTYYMVFLRERWVRLGTDHFGSDFS